MSHANLSRRAIMAGAAALPALAVPVLASTATSASACTLPPDLIERFVRVRAWYLDYERREKLWRDEVDRRFNEATGVTGEQYHDMNYNQRCEGQLNDVRSRICNEVQLEEKYETECDDLCDERWGVAKAMMAHTPRTIADLAYQVEAFLVADLEIISGEPKDGGDWQLRMLLHHIRTLGALLLPENSFGGLHIDITEPRRAEEEDDDSDVGDEV